MKVMVMLSGQGGLDGFKGPFDVPEDVYEEGDIVEYLEREGELELGDMQSASVVTKGDLEFIGKQAADAIKRMEAI